MRYHTPIHVTAISSFAATFDFRVNTGLTGILSEGPGPDSLSFPLGSSAAENPTVTIIPVQGEEFAQPILTPITENNIHFLAQGALILRSSLGSRPAGRYSKILPVNSASS